LSHYAKRVYLIHRRDQLRAGQVLCSELPRIEMSSSGIASRVLPSAKPRNISTDSVCVEGGGRLCCCGVITANLRRRPETDDSGAIIRSRTSPYHAGRLCCRDIRKNSPRQIAVLPETGCRGTLCSEVSPDPSLTRRPGPGDNKKTPGYLLRGMMTTLRSSPSPTL
jgi:hypothetical protein